MRVECFHSIDAVAPYRDAINELNLASSDPDPFSTFEYCESLVRSNQAFAAGGNAALWFLAAFRDNVLIGYLALKSVSRKILWRSSTALDFLVDHDTDRPHIVAAPDDVAAITRTLLMYLLARNDWDLVEFQQQSAASLLWTISPRIPLRGFRALSWPTMQNHTIALRWNALADYVQSLEKKFRSEVRRQLRRLLDKGDLSLLTSSDPAATPALLDLYYAIEQRSWKSRANLSVGAHAVRAASVRALLPLNDRLRVIMQILLLNGLPIAGLINYSFDTPAGGLLYAMHIAFDDQYAECSPGSAMLLFGIRHAIDGGYRSYNLLSGFGYYKSRWLAEATPTQSVQFFRWGSPPYWRRLFGDVRRKLFNRKVVERGLTLRDDAVVSDEPELESHRMAERSDVERQKLFELVAQARRHNCEYLSPQSLLQSLPLQANDKKSAQSRNVGTEIETRSRECG